MAAVLRFVMDLFCQAASILGHNKVCRTDFATRDLTLSLSVSISVISFSVPSLYCSSFVVQNTVSVSHSIAPFLGPTLTAPSPPLPDPSRPAPVLTPPRPAPVLTPPRPAPALTRCRPVRSTECATAV